MEESGFIARRADAEDGRVKTVVLAPRGRSLLVEVERIYDDLEEEWAQVIGETALRQTRNRLERVVRHRQGGELPQLRP